MNVLKSDMGYFKGWIGSVPEFTSNREEAKQLTDEETGEVAMRLRLKTEKEKA